ncbi:hypothetical protein [Algibacter sp. L4_22]|uniref:hypothetical protein n=1 Tax=Algibacter sp. L4_22 TaxID=2942477 RepID=UPI00201B6D74|nr:hypothetical protein [Algibacter sp. L4_22]MCL5126994.1 hypothetical protein [Algibacter sp. L4_22]
MKKLGVLILCISLFVSCKNDNKSNEIIYQDDDLTLLKGEFVYYDGAAVLQTSTEIYGVFLTDKLEELNKQAEAFKNHKTDMVTIEIRGKVTQEKDEKILWENKVEILKIISVKPANNQNEGLIKLGS